MLLSCNTYIHKKKERSGLYEQEKFSNVYGLRAASCSTFRVVLSEPLRTICTIT